MTAEDLLVQLHRRADGTVAEGGTGDVLGPDLFGRRRPEPAPDFLAGHAYSHLAPAQVLRFLELMNLLRPTPSHQEMDPASWEPAEPVDSERIAPPPPGRPRMGWSPRANCELLPESIRAGIPKVWFTIWTGWGGNRVLRPVGRGAKFWEQLTQSTQDHPDVTFVHLTEATRTEARDALKQGYEPSEPDAADVWKLVRWAENRRIILVNIHELLSVDQTGWVHHTLLARRNQRDGQSLGEFSDLLRLWVLYLFGGLYLDGNKALLSGTVFADVAASVPGFGGTEGKNAGLIAFPRHPLILAMMEQIRENFGKDQVELARDGTTYQGNEMGRRSLNATLRLPVIERTGPGVLRRALFEAGWSDPPSSRDTPPFPIPIQDPFEGSWQRDDTGPRRTPAPEEVLDTVADLVNRLVADLDDGRGHLDLIAIESTLAELPNPEESLAAVLSFLAAREKLRTRVLGVFDHHWKCGTEAGKYSLTPFAYQHISTAFFCYLPELPPLIGDGQGVWMLNKKAARAILLAPGQTAPTAEELATEQARTRPDDFGLHSLPDDPWPKEYLDEAVSHLAGDLTLSAENHVKAHLVLSFIASADRSTLTSKYYAAESARAWRRQAAEILGLRDYDPAEPLPVPGPEGRLLLATAMGAFSVHLTDETTEAIVGAIVHVHRRHFAPMP
jgi:hypothetical protein